MKLQLLKLITVLSVLLQPLVGLEVRDKPFDLAEASLWNYYPAPIVRLVEQFEALELPDFQIDTKDDVVAISFIQPMATQDVVNNFLRKLQANPQTGGHPWKQSPLS